MKIILSTAIFFCLVAYAMSYFLAPSILGPRPAVKFVCESFPIARLNDPYLSCINDARLKISRALLMVATPEMCPLQYVNGQTPPNCGFDGRHGIDVSNDLKLLCEGKQECFFFFGQLPELQGCDTSASYYQTLNVTYTCELPRTRFRPFSNRRYDSKFLATLNHPIRKMSYNHLLNL